MCLLLNNKKKIKNKKKKMAANREKMKTDKYQNNGVTIKIIIFKI